MLRRCAGTVWGLLQELDRRLLALSLGNVIGQTMQNIAIVFWFDSFGLPLQQTLYPVLLSTGIVYFLFFSLLAVAYVLISSAPHRRRAIWISRRFFTETVIVGYLNSLCCIFTIFSSSPNRVPPIPQTFLQNFSGLFAFLPQRWTLQERDKNFCECLPLVSTLFITGGTLLAISPQFSDPSEGIGGVAGLPWIGVFLLSILFNALYNVRQQLALHSHSHHDHIHKHSHSHHHSHGHSHIHSHALGAPPKGDDDGDSGDTIVPDSLNLLAYSCAVMLLCIALGFWFNLLPWFGGTPMSVEQMLRTLGRCFGCIFAFDRSACPDTWWIGICYNVGWVISYMAAAPLNKVSATYSVLSTIPVSPVCVLMWLIVPRFNPSHTIPPWWSVWPSLFMLITGLLCWQVWEVRHMES